MAKPMELTVRTTHGSADIAVTLRSEGATLRDIIAATTGQAAPTAVLVDNQLVDTRAPLATLPVFNGSIIDTDLDRNSTVDAVVNLLQLTGPGAGTILPLPPGRYRIGPSTRASGPELNFDTVEAAEFELDVDANGATVSPGTSTSTIALDGAPLTEARSWTGASLAVGGRVFMVEPAGAQRQQSRPTTDGTIVHNRPPGEPGGTGRFLVDSVLDARDHRHGLWHQRAATAAMPISVGLADDAQQVDGSGNVTLDLNHDGIVAITGHSQDGEAVLRSLLIDAVTRYGPSDLAVAIVASRERLEMWDWAKWLPHLRHDDLPDLLSNELEVASWAAHVSTTPGKRVLLAVTDTDSWNHAGAPLRDVLINRPDRVTVIALCRDRIGAPVSASTLIELDAVDPGRACLVHLSRAARTELRVGLVDLDVAADIARHLAPLVDPDLPIDSPASVAPTTPTLAEIVSAHEAASRWDSQLGKPASQVKLGIGALVGAVVGIDLGLDRGVVISGSSIDEADNIAEVIALSMGSTWSPNELSIVEVDHRRASEYDAARQLPHFAGTFSDRGDRTAKQFESQLRRLVSSNGSAGKRLAIFVHGLGETELAAPGLVTALTELADQTSGVHIVVTTAMPLASLDASIRRVCPVEIAVDRYGGALRATVHDRDRQLPRLGGTFADALDASVTRAAPATSANGALQATVQDRDPQFRTPFLPDDPPPDTGDAVSVQPFLFGRPPSPLERRLGRVSDSAHQQPDRAVRRLVDGLRNLADERQIARPMSLIPVPLPLTLDAESFLTQDRRDGIPIGLIETAESTTPVPHWWQPGPTGSILALGAARSGIRALLDVLACGIVDRFATDDLIVVAIEHQAGRRSALESIPHVTNVASPEQPDVVMELIGNAQAELRRRLADTAFRISDHPAHLLLVRDVERLTPEARSALAELAQHGAVAGINVVATGSHPVDAEELLGACSTVLVASLSDPDAYGILGIEQPERFALITGRCHAIIDGESSILQLASLENSLDLALALTEKTAS
ncbi:MAG: S-DNA-T family DNA segregation ATPase FtsK/SpoIIIE [Ilumatobacter sp.]|jgi:S-DNA-T family DNA segregation ATPase FtsK/SpoIIIE